MLGVVQMELETDIWGQAIIGGSGGLWVVCKA